MTDAARIRVLLDKGRNYLTSFFVELAEVHKELGDDKEFARWCNTQLGVGISVLVGLRKTLRQADAAKVKEEFARVIKTVRAMKAAEAAQARIEAAQRAIEKKRTAEQRAAAKVVADVEKKRVRKNKQNKKSYNKKRKAILKAKKAAAKAKVKALSKRLKACDPLANPNPA